MFKMNGGINIVFFTMIVCCTQMSNDIERPVDLPHPGMKKISGAGTSFFQGWNDTLASLDEKPGMRSTFTYDIWMDTTEITQKQYYDMTGKTPLSDSVRYGVGDRYPVCFVTWFDAVLFCNARSRADGLDTVYRYSRRYTVPGGGVWQLTDLQCDFSKDGYRLPTEAEWEFVARGESSALPFSTSSDLISVQSVAWFGANSLGTTQPVATKAPNSTGLYDLAGNVFEWTNDWKGAYNGNAITNSLGAFRPNSSYEKIIKGGSYNSSLTYLRPSYRSAVFPTSVSSANEQVGFRCARGALPDGKYFDTSGSIPFNFKIDSFGLYNDPPTDRWGSQETFATKMHLFWKLHNDIDLVFMGGGLTYCGVDCSRFRNYKALNMGFAGCALYFISTVISNYVSVHAPKLKLIAIDVPLYGEHYESSFETTIGQSKGYQYDKNHNFWKDAVPPGFDEVMARQPYPSLEENWWDSLGLKLYNCYGWGGTNPEQTFARNWAIDDSEYIKYFTAFVNLIEECSARHLHLLIINFPMSPYYKNTPYFTRVGPSWETGRAIVAQLKALETLYPYFHVYDAYQDGNHDYTDAEAASYDILCPNGAKKLADRLNTLIESILKR